MSIPLATFEVYGIPRPQGSKRAFVANGHAVMKEQAGDAFASWRNAVADKAREIAKTYDAPLDGPMLLSVHFRFPMPASARKCDRIAGSRWKSTAPDTSKLIRALEDGLQAAGLITDDARFAMVAASKHEVYEQWTGALVTIERLP